MDIVLPFFVFIFGLLIGSFLNVVIFRVEKNEHLGGRSYCPSCKKPLAWHDLVPVFSFLWLRGKCRNCKQKISWQYPIIEIVTGLLFLLIFNFQFSIFNTLFLFYVAAVLIVIFVIDLKFYLIPDRVLLPAIVAAFFYRVLNFGNWDLFGNWSLVIGISPLAFNFILASVIGSSFFLMIFLVSKGVWMGFGDVKLAIFLGLLVGFPGILLALFLAFLFGAIIGVIGMLAKKKGLKSELPFAPFLIIGTWVTLFFGEQIVNWYMHALTL